MAKPTKRKVQGGRTTPKSGTGKPASSGMIKPSTASAAKPVKTTTSGAAAPKESGRYTAPIPKEFRESSMWVPIFMFALLGVGTALILLNYTGIFWDTSNWYLLGGLGLILGGIVTATQYR